MQLIYDGTVEEILAELQRFAKSHIPTTDHRDLETEPQPELQPIPLDEKPYVSRTDLRHICHSNGKRRSLKLLEEMVGNGVVRTNTVEMKVGKDVCSVTKYSTEDLKRENYLEKCQTRS